MNGYRESDSPIVSEKPSNKTGDNKPVAEKVEKRGWLRGIHPSETGARHRAGYSCQMSWIGYGLSLIHI